jgi:hypothetical protein
VGWDSVEGVVSSCAVGFASMGVGLERLTELGVEGCIFLYLVWVGRVRGWPGLRCIGVLCVVGVHFSAWMGSAFLPPGSLLMVAALCGVGGNWIVQSWRGHGLDADGG